MSTSMIFSLEAVTKPNTTAIYVRCYDVSNRMEYVSTGRSVCSLFLKLPSWGTGSTGRASTQQRVEVQEAPKPRDKQQLQPFFRLLNFYNRLLKKAAHHLEPLHQLLRKDRPWRWGPVEAPAFERAKKLLTSPDILVHYDLEKPLGLACDAFPHGLGFVLSHEMKAGCEDPVAFGSKTLTSAEWSYSQTDREALAVVSGVKNLCQFLYGRHFRIYTDHKPLLGLLHHNKPIPAVLSPRVLRWNLLLSQYDYELVYRPGGQMGNADMFSRLPLPEKHTDGHSLAYVLLLEAVPETPGRKPGREADAEGQDSFLWWSARVV